MNTSHLLRTVFALLVALTPTLLAATTTPAQTVTSPISAASVVRELYRVHNNGRGHVFEARGKASMYKFFDKRLADLIWKDIHDTPDGEVGNLDFDPLYNAQDTKIRQFQIGAPVLEGDNATVVVSFRNFEELVKIKFLMAKRGPVWKIANIVYGDDSDLIKILSSTN